MRKINFVILFCGFLLPNFAQQLNLTINKDEVSIGEPFTLVFSIESPTPIDSLQYEIQLENFNGEVSEKNKNKITKSVYSLEISMPFKDTAFQDSNAYIWKGKYEVIGWDSAFVMIPPQPIIFNDSTFYFPPGIIKINSPATNPTQPIYDIQEVFTEIKAPPFSFLNGLKKYGWILSILAVAIAIYLFWHNKKKKETPFNLEEDTLKKLTALENSKLYEEDLKEYYFQLSLILRKFLSLHYTSSLMEKTTPEIGRMLKKQGLEKQLIDIIKQLLSQSDMVKFAQSKPSLNDILNVMNKAKNVVITITQKTKTDE